MPIEQLTGYEGLQNLRDTFVSSDRLNVELVPPAPSVRTWRIVVVSISWAGVNGSSIELTVSEITGDTLYRRSGVAGTNVEDLPGPIVLNPAASLRVRLQAVTGMTTGVLNVGYYYGIT